MSVKYIRGKNKQLRRNTLVCGPDRAAQSHRIFLHVTLSHLCSACLTYLKLQTEAQMFQIIVPDKLDTDYLTVRGPDLNRDQN